MANYIAEYSFELLEPEDDGKMGGYASLFFESDEEIETPEQWTEVARQCFHQGNGRYSKVQVTRLGVMEHDIPMEDDIDPKDLLTEGEIIE